MNWISKAFNSLFNEAYKKCFGYPLKESLSETESKLFSNRLFDQTGLVVGWKSLKNYSSFIADGLTETGKSFYCHARQLGALRNGCSV